MSLEILSSSLFENIEQIPGVSSAQAIQQNHAMLLHPKAEMGVLEGNPLHEDMVEATISKDGAA